MSTRPTLAHRSAVDRPTTHRSTIDRPAVQRRTGATRPPVDRASAGQATAEYALVLLGAAAVALMLAAWAAKTGAIGDLFDAVVGRLLSEAG